MLQYNTIYVLGISIRQVASITLGPRYVTKDPVLEEFDTFIKMWDAEKNEMKEYVNQIFQYVSLISIAIHRSVIHYFQIVDVQSATLHCCTKYEASAIAIIRVFSINA